LDGRDSVELALAEKRTGLLCIGAQSGYSGAKRWEDKPRSGRYITVLAEVESQQDPTFQRVLCLYATNDKISPEALQQAGVEESILPLRKWDGIDFESPGLPIAKSGQSKAKKKYLKRMQYLRTLKQKISLIRIQVSND
jgi:hypothetical protein